MALPPPVDPTFFFDYFTGSDGPLSGHTPDTPFAGLTWSGSGLSLASNAAVSADQTHTGSFGTSTYGTPYTSYGGPINSVTNLLFTTGPDVGANANGHKGFALNINANGQDVYVALSANAAGAWTIAITAEGYTDSRAVTLIASTLYDIKIQINTGGSYSASVTLASTELETSTVYPPSPTTYAGYGISSYALTVGATCIVDEIGSTGPANGVLSVMTLPHVTLVASGTGPPGGSAALVLPALTLAGSFGGQAAGSLPAITLSAIGHNSTGERAAAISLPALTMTGYGGGNAAMTLGAPVLAITGTFWGVGRAALTLPGVTMTASGTVSGTAQADLTLPALTMAGYGGAVLSATIGKLTMSGSGTGGSVGRAAVTLPMFELQATATAQNHGSAALTLPAIVAVSGGRARLTLPGFTLTAVGHAVVTATYEAYAVNLQHNSDKANDEVTRYTNYPFNQVVRYQGRYYGVGAGGMFLLEGALDLATPIPWVFQTTPNDLDSPMQKRPVSCYFGGRLGPASTVTLYAGEKSGTAYAHSTPRGATAQNYRQTFGLGIKDRYYALGLSGTGAIELDDIEFNFPPLSRRI